jgi:cyclophilin family peptidyl-prolyl cis-trans isomerase
MLRATLFIRQRVSPTLKNRDFMPYDPVLTNPVVFLDINGPDYCFGRVTVELFADIVPKTAENFRSLCTGERGETRWVDNAGKITCPLHFKGIPFHRCIRDFVLQGGDILHKDGRGESCIFGLPFPDESREGKARFHKSGTLAMASKGPNRNGSQFYFNLRDNANLDGKFVVFGQVVQGWDVVRNVAIASGTRCGVPSQPIWISECGQAGGSQPISFSPSADDDGGLDVMEQLRPRH